MSSDNIWSEKACVGVCVFINNKIARSWEPASLTEVNSFVAFFAHKSPCMSRSIADTTSCLDRGSSLLSLCSTQATGLLGTWMLKQLWNNDSKIKYTSLLPLLVKNHIAKQKGHKKWIWERERVIDVDI